MKLKNIAALVGGQMAPEHEDIEIQGPAALQNAQAGSISFCGNSKYFSALRTTQATAVLVPEDFREGITPVCIWVKNPKEAFAQLLQHFAPPPIPYPREIHPTAVIASSASVHSTASIGPYVVIEADAVIGARSILNAGVYIGHECQVGEDCHCFPHVTLYSRCQVGHRVRIHSGAVVGADGFGVDRDKNGKTMKVPQTGTVQIEDDVEIGANTTIDRARFGRTRIQSGTHIDNLVQVGHNSDIGKNGIICGQTGLGGTTTLEEGVTLAGQVGIAGHLTIGRGSIIAAQSGITHSIPAGQILAGSPARPIQEFRKQAAYQSRQEAVHSRLKKLELQMNEILQSLQATGEAPPMKTGTPF